MKTELTQELSLEWCLVDAGPFLMGSKVGDGNEDENPQHEIEVDRFWIGKYPITNAQYACFILDSGRQPPPYLNKPHPRLSVKDHPVVAVKWDDAVAFCEWASQLTGFAIGLPTETQWEKAARGPDGRKFPWGNKCHKTYANYGGHHRNTTPVGHYADQCGPYGAFDQAGNVSEWTASWYKPYPDSTFDASTYAKKRMVVRGGGWGSPRKGVRVANRGYLLPSAGAVSVGFRCLMVP